MLLDTPISDIMTPDVITIGTGDTLRDALSTFNNHNLRHAPVTANGRLVGMISLVDLKKRPGSGFWDRSEVAGEFASLPVGRVMTQDPVSVQAEDSVGELARIFAENEFHAVPVLEGERVVGIATTTDVIRYFLENLS